MGPNDRTKNGFFFSSGIDGRTGEYLLPALTAEEVVEGLHRPPRNRERSLIPGIDPKSLAESGWGIVFHERENPEVREALAPLIEHRKAQASQHHERLFQEFNDETAFCDEKDNNKEDFLNNRGATLGPVNPHRMPFYLLLVGDPTLIPFHFQHQLDVQYAVGRICFDTPEEYARYAKSVIGAEMGGMARNRRMSFFGVRNAGDQVTELMSDYLVRPLAERLGRPEPWQKSTGWEVQTVVAEEATKERLGRLVGGEEIPALLFTASHGMGFPCGDPLQRSQQGALLCQDWPGLGHAPLPAHCFSADDVADNARLHGLVAFHFACHGAGTQRLDEFAAHNSRPPRTIAPDPFVARLPQRLLGSGALAVIGHVERAWVYSFLSKGSTSQVAAFESTLRLLMEGYPVGFAMEYFNQQYAELATDLTLALQCSGYGKALDPGEIKDLWIANNDARNYAVLGDPAVRVAVR